VKLHRTGRSSTSRCSHAAVAALVGAQAHQRSPGRQPGRAHTIASDDTPASSMAIGGVRRPSRGLPQPSVSNRHQPRRNRNRSAVGATPTGMRQGARSCSGHASTRRKGPRRRYQSRGDCCRAGRRSTRRCNRGRRLDRHPSSATRGVAQARDGCRCDVSPPFGSADGPADLGLAVVIGQPEEAASRGPQRKQRRRFTEKTSPAASRCPYSLRRCMAAAGRSCGGLPAKKRAPVAPSTSVLSGEFHDRPNRYP